MEDLHKIWPHRWINPKTESRKTNYHGLGVFAKELIQKGEIVAVLGGVIVPGSEIKTYWNKMGHIGIQIDENFFIVPTRKEELEETGVFNHSCDPNIGFKNSIQFIAIRNIQKDEELVFDYAFNETLMKDFECKCGSADCRKIITKNDWKNKNIQEKYKEFFSPYLHNKLK